MGTASGVRRRILRVRGCPCALARRAMDRVGRVMRALVALAIVGGLVACSGSAQTTSGADSNTPRIESRDTTLRAGLVTLPELRRVIGLSGVRSVSLKGAPFKE